MARRSGAATPPTLAGPGTARLPAGLLDELRGFILEARRQTARLVDAGLTLLYWQVGARIRREVLRNKRADYGERIVSALSRQLEAEFGRGFSEKSLRHMLRFAEAVPDREILSTLGRPCLSHEASFSTRRNRVREPGATLCQPRQSWASAGKRRAELANPHRE